MTGILLPEELEAIGKRVITSRQRPTDIPYAAVFKDRADLYRHAEALTAQVWKLENALLVIAGGHASFAQNFAQETLNPSDPATGQ